MYLSEKLDPPWSDDVILSVCRHSVSGWKSLSVC